MRIRADEHISPLIVEMVRKLALSDGWELTSIRDPEVSGQGQSDVHWVTLFARDGGQAILSADTDFQKTPPQVAAIFQTGLKVIHLPSRWANAPRHLQAAHILMWWKRIEIQLQNMKDRECFRPEYNISEAGKLKRVQIDFQKANKKMRKSKRRNQT